MIEEVATSNAPSGTPGPKVSSQGRPIEPSNSSENAKRVVRRHVNEKVLPSQKISSVPQSSSPASVRSFQPTRGIPFTERDKQSLLDIYDDVMNVAEDETIRAWNAWADAVNIVSLALEYPLTSLRSILDIQLMNGSNSGSMMSNP